MDGRRAAWRAATILFVVALAFRVWDFGNPVVRVDEEWYLLVGDRILHGAIPYIDLWDRKPVGLFLFFAAIRLLPGDGVLAYQVAALLFAAATAWVVRGAARTLGVRERAALVAGVVYLGGLSMLGGGGGQAPVFYDLFVAIGGWLSLRTPRLAAPSDRRAIVLSGTLACALAGVAIQMKYTPAIEGAAFGLAHLVFLRRAGAGRGRTAAVAGWWVFVGLAPTLAALGWYAAHGWTATFRFANFTSIGLRAGYPTGQLAMRLLGIVAQTLPSLLGAGLAWRLRPRRGVAAAAYRVAYGWLAAATVAFLSIGTFFDHYALPLLAPLAIVAAVAFDRYRGLRVAAIALPVGLVGGLRLTEPSDAAGARAVAAVVARNSGAQCPYVFVGDTATYLLANACLPTRYAFPNLLAYATERGATGIDEAGEVRRILARRPPVVVTSDRRLSIWNPASLFAVKAALAADYRPVFATRRATWHTVVYLRDDRPYRR